MSTTSTDDTSTEHLEAIDEDSLVVSTTAVVDRREELPFQAIHATLGLPDPADDTRCAIIGHASMWVLPDDNWAGCLRGADELGGDLYAAVETLYLASIDDECGFEASGRVLFVESVTIDDEWRGNGWGIGFVRDAIRSLGDFAGVICQPAPLAVGISDDERSDAIGRLGAHWAQLGFAPMAGEVWGVDFAYSGPLTD